MRRLFIATGLLVAGLTLTACGGSAKAASEATSAPVTSQNNTTGTPTTPAKTKPSETPVAPKKVDNAKVYLAAVYKDEPNLKKNDPAQLIDDAKNICQYVVNAGYKYDAWFSITNTGEFAGVQNGSAYARLNVSSAAVKYYCPGVGQRLAQTPEAK